MTIAACYVSSEGVVLGADSTSTTYVDGPRTGDGALHHLNFAQKVFEVGEQSTIGITMWGMGSINDLSHRTLIARFADEISRYSVASMSDLATRFAASASHEYQTRLRSVLDEFLALDANQQRSPQEEQEWENLNDNLRVGFCIAGYLPFERDAQAYEIDFNPSQQQPPTPTRLDRGSAYFWGCPNIIHRVIYGCDPAVLYAIRTSGHWQGTDQELIDLVLQHRLAQPFDLPLREAIDWVNTVIYTTIKSMKFSHHLPVCGGPIEIAVISTDRPFRWVKHKRFDEAIG